MKGSPDGDRRDMFDFVVAFGGSSTLSAYVKTAISESIVGIGVDKTSGIWQTISHAVGRDMKLLHTNNVIVIYRERGEGIKCRQIGLHCPPLRAWGFEFKACAKSDCRPSQHDFIIRDNDVGVRMTCRVCEWQSASLKFRDVEGLLYRLSRTTPDVFWHEYPPSAELENVFVSTTERKGSQGRA